MDPSTPSPTGSPATNTPAASKPAMNSKGIGAAALFLIGGILGLVSAFSAWWAYSGGGYTISFLPGSNTHESGGGMSATTSYSSLGLGTVGNLYEATLGLAIAGGVLLLIAGLIGFVAAVRSPSGRFRGALMGLGIVGILLLIVAVAMVPAAQPWAIKQGSNSACTGYNGTTPCSGFWGSASQAGTSYTFGAAVGWYLALVGLILGIVAFVLWRSGNRSPRSS